MFKFEDLTKLPVNYATFTEYKDSGEISNNNVFWECLMISIEELQTSRFLKFSPSKPISKIALLSNVILENE